MSGSGGAVGDGAGFAVDAADSVMKGFLRATSTQIVGQPVSDFPWANCRSHSRSPRDVAARSMLRDATSSRGSRRDSTVLGGISPGPLMFMGDFATCPLWRGI